jgi:quinol monooxygenase YgiN
MRRKWMLLMVVLFAMLGTQAVPSPAIGEPGLLTLTAKLTVKAGKEQEFETTMKGIVPKVREEAGNRAYVMCRSKDNPRLFFFFEEYVDQAAIEAHRQHLKTLGVDLAAFLDGPPMLEYYDKLAF